MDTIIDSDTNTEMGQDIYAKKGYEHDKDTKKKSINSSIININFFIKVSKMKIMEI